MHVLLTAADRRERSKIAKMLRASGVGDIAYSGEGLWTTGSGDGPTVDAVVAVLSGSRDQLGSVYLDIGYARALRRPVLVLSDEPAFSELLPDVTVLLGGLQNVPALRFHLDTFIESVRRPVEEGTLPERTQNLSTDWAIQELRDIRAIENSLTRGELFEQLVEHLLRRTNANVVAHDLYGRGQFDFVASIPDTNFGTGPIAIECRSAATPRSLASAARKLQVAVIERGAALGVLIYDEVSPESRSRISPVPMVVTIGIDELIQGLGNRSLGRVLSDARNRAVNAL